MIVPRLAPKGGDGRLGRQQVAAQVDVEGLGEGGVEDLVVDGVEPEVVVEQANAVDEHVEAAEPVDGRLDRPVDVGSAGGIAAEDRGLRGRQLQRLTLGAIELECGDLGPLGHEGTEDRPPDTGAGADDQGARAGDHRKMARFWVRRTLSSMVILRWARRSSPSTSRRMS